MVENRVIPEDKSMALEKNPVVEKGPKPQQREQRKRFSVLVLPERPDGSRQNITHVRHPKGPGTADSAPWPPTLQAPAGIKTPPIERRLVHISARNPSPHPRRPSP